jgi:hypothetical protein
MTDTAASIAADVIASLQADGIDARFTLLKAGQPTGPERDKRPGVPTEHEGTCIGVSGVKAEREGMSIEGAERIFAVYGLDVEPSTQDKARFFGQPREWSIKQVKPNTFGEGAYSYLIKLSR